MYRFALRPKWVIGHLIAVGAVIGFVFAGFWQLDRHEQRSERNDAVEDRRDQPAVPLAELADAPIDEVEWRLVTVSGEWVPDEQVLIRGRSYQERPGFEVVTPLDTGEGVVLVNRGWIPVSEGDDPLAAPLAPAAGEQELTARLRDTETRSGIGARDPDEGVLERFNRIDVDRIAQQVDGEVFGSYLELVEPAPPRGGLPVPPELPDLSPGPHLGYAGQWFLFTLVVLIGYPLLLRHQARDGEVEDPEEPAEPALS